MKTLYLVVTIFLMNTAVLASTRLCPVQTKSILSCKATAFIPLVPFVSICESTSGEQSIVMDPGASRRPMEYPAKVSISADVQTWKAIDAEFADNLTLIYNPKSNLKHNGVLSFDSIFYSSEKFVCR